MQTQRKGEEMAPRLWQRMCKGGFSWSCWISMHLILNTKAHVQRCVGIIFACKWVRNAFNGCWLWDKTHCELNLWQWSLVFLDDQFIDIFQCPPCGHVDKITKRKQYAIWIVTEADDISQPMEAGGHLPGASGRRSSEEFCHPVW